MPPGLLETVLAPVERRPDQPYLLGSRGSCATRSDTPANSPMHLAGPQELRRRDSSAGTHDGEGNPEGAVTRDAYKEARLSVRHGLESTPSLAQGALYGVRVGSLSWWFAAHPAWEPGEDWPQEVPVVCYENEDECILIDPFLPQDGSFDPHGKTVRVLLTQGAHFRGTAELVERYGASVWTPPHAVWRKIPNPATTNELPAGIEALELEGEPQQVVFLIPEHATLVTGDVLTGRDGVMRVFVDEADPEPLLASLERIAELPIERVIVPHCETPIFSDGAAHIRAAVVEARQS